MIQDKGSDSSFPWTFMRAPSSMYSPKTTPLASAVPKDTWELPQDVSPGLPEDSPGLFLGSNWGLPEKKSVTFEDNGECIAMDISGE